MITCALRKFLKLVSLISGCSFLLKLDMSRPCPVINRVVLTALSVEDLYKICPYKLDRSNHKIKRELQSLAWPKSVHYSS